MEKSLNGADVFVLSCAAIGALFGGMVVEYVPPVMAWPGIAILVGFCFYILVGEMSRLGPYQRRALTPRELAMWNYTKATLVALPIGCLVGAVICALHAR